MKKVLISMLAIALASTMLVGCGTDDNGSKKDLGDAIDSTMDNAGSAIDKGMDDISKAADDLMSDVESPGR